MEVEHTEVDTYQTAPRAGLPSSETNVFKLGSERIQLMAVLDYPGSAWRRWKRQVRRAKRHLLILLWINKLNAEVITRVEPRL